MSQMKFVLFLVLYKKNSQNVVKNMTQNDKKELFVRLLQTYKKILICSTISNMRF